MKILYPGHRYALDILDAPEDRQTRLLVPLQFVQRKPHHVPMPGTTNQEVCRALIDRVKVLNAEVPWVGNAEILRCLRRVIFLHELRAYLRHREKLGLPTLHPLKAERYVIAHIVNTIGYADKYGNAAENIEDIPVNDDGHWELQP
jgi:hypothetical protein